MEILKHALKICEAQIQEGRDIQESGCSEVARADDRGEEAEGSRELSIYKEAMESSSDI